MRNKQFAVTTTNLNTHADVFVDTMWTITQTTPTGNIGSVDNYPKKIQIFNETGIDVYVNILSNEAEYLSYVADPTQYNYFTIKSGTNVVMTSINVLPTAYKIVVKGGTGSATKDLVIECIQYIPIR